MEFSDSPRDLFAPGKAENFFDLQCPDELDAASRAETFSRGAAVWLAEFSRLIYRQEASEIGADAQGRTRDEILRPQGWREVAFHQRNGTQAAVFAREDTSCAALVFRGTQGIHDLLTDGDILMTRWQGSGRVHGGFHKAFQKVWPWCAEQLRSLDCTVFFTGHSLGAALATLAAAQAMSDPALGNPAALYTFGSPRVGDTELARSTPDLPHFRFVNGQDIIASVPPAFAVPGFPVYQHSGSMHLAKPDQTLQIAPTGTDGEPVGASGFEDFKRVLATLLRQIEGEAPLPASLMDHAPVNYVARLERL